MDNLSLKINKTKLNKYVLAVFILSVFWVKSFEFSLLLTLLLTIFYLPKIKITKPLIEVLLLLSLIIIVAIPNTFVYKSSAFDILKGLLYYLKPILMILLGYMVILRIKDWSFFFKLIIYLSLFFASIHIIIAIDWFFSDEPITVLRYRSGKGSLIEILGFVFFIARKKIGITFSKSRRRFIFLLLASSALLYFSRTQIIGIVILLLSVYGFTKLSTKSIMVISGLVLSLIIFFAILNNTDLERGAPGVEGFLYKVKIAPQEVFSSEINIEDHSDLWDKWRSYEAKKAFEQTFDKGLPAIVIGNGLGAKVDLEIDYLISGIPEKEIPILHNGYAFLIFKSGLLGLFFYLLFLLRLYIKTYFDNNDNLKLNLIRKFISGFGFYLLFSTLIISGLYNINGILSLFLGCLLGLEKLTKEIS